MPSLKRLSPDLRIVAAVIAAYAVASVILPRPGMAVYLLVAGLLFFAAVAAVATRARGGGAAVLSMLMVSYAGLALLAAPALVGTDLPGVFIGCLGSQAGALLWMTLRSRPEPTPKPRSSFRKVAQFAVGCAALVGVLATIPISIMLLSGEPGARMMLWVYPAYLVGALAAAAVYWLLQGMAHRPAGRYLIGALGGFCVYGACAPLVAAVDPEATGGVLLAIGIVCGVLVGPPVAMNWNEQFW